ncbi:MAG: hypothetical protein HQK91_10550 [Nitrospirae bacterium]|nr:hypothetical protein [Nitrospirota bacterium]MBF0541873.1 hypothetical protein [Nitrospirota bacterium]
MIENNSNEIQIIFPQQCGENIDKYMTVLDLFNKSKDLSPITIKFNCYNVNFITPFGLNLLSAMMYHHSINSNKVLIILPFKKEVKKYLTDMGFFEAFNLSGINVVCNQRSTSVKLIRLDNINMSYLDEISSWISYSSNINIKEAEHLVKINLRELIYNIFDHSQSKIGGYICAQHYPRSSELQLSIIDFGIGFYATLNPFYDNIKNHVDAILMAVEEGITSKNGTRGSGLPNIVGYLYNIGEIEIISNNGFWKSDINGKVETRFLSQQLNGVLINLKINTRLIPNELEPIKDVWDG